MKNRMKNAALLVFALLALALAVWGPEALTRYKDRQMLDEIHVVAAEESGEGYRYKLGGTYAFVVNHRGPSEEEIPEEDIFTACTSGLKELKKLGILPASLREVEASDYDAVLYSAIDVLEPRNNVAVWKVSLSDSQKNTDRNNRLIDAYLDADSGRIYEFYVRTSQKWGDIEPDALVEAWREYMGLDAPEPYESDNPLLETTPYFQKYVFEGIETEKTIVTVGFYDGINELFLKISQ